MSQLKHRKENDCLNCGAKMDGNYCHVCGQENLETKESFWSLLTHFVYDITHFDGKFFTTVKYLLFKPGFLSREYLKGRRHSYLHPIRMYIFTSAIFFLIYFSFYQTPLVAVETKTDSVAELITDLKSKKKVLETTLATPISETAKANLIKRITNITDDINALQKDSTVDLEKIKSLYKPTSKITFSSNAQKYKNFADYDSAQKSLPSKDRDNFILRALSKKNIYLNEKYKNDGNSMLKETLENFRHRFPQMLFVSLPIFALILKLLYRRQKSFFYVDHVVYSIHLYCAIFVIILIALWLNSIAIWAGIQTEAFNFIFTFSGFIYSYKGLRNFYEQRRAKTILKFSLLVFVTFFLLLILSVLFLFFTLLTI